MLRQDGSQDKCEFCRSTDPALKRDGLADRTRLHAHRVTHRLLRHATQWGVVHQNVAGLVDAPTVADKEIEILTSAQVQAVLQTLRGRSLYPIATVALGTGMRRGELMALRRQDVNLDGAVLRVERALEQTKRGGLVFRAPKTRYGRRMITLPPSTVTELRRHLLAQQEQRLALGLGKAPEDSLVFATWDGRTRSPNALTTTAMHGDDRRGRLLPEGQQEQAEDINIVAALGISPAVATNPDTCPLTTLVPRLSSASVSGSRRNGGKKMSDGKPSSSQLEPPAVTVKEARRLLGDKCNNSAYEAVGSGALEAVKDRRKTLVTMRSIRAYMDAMPPAKIKAPPQR